MSFSSVAGHRQSKLGHKFSTTVVCVVCLSLCMVLYLGTSRSVMSLATAGPLTETTPGVNQEDLSKDRNQFNQSVVDEPFKQTTVTGHAPGWTIFDDLYMSNGTFFIVTSQEENPGLQDPAMPWRDSRIPNRRFMISTGLPGFDTPQSYQEREPTDQELMVITKEEAISRWGDRLTLVDGHSWLYQDSGLQYLAHFYHFVAETLFGSWGFHVGMFGGAVTARGETTAPTPTRLIFMKATAEQLRDPARFNFFYLKAAFRAVAVETSIDWADRVYMTRGGDKAWLFPKAMLVDRSAAFRSPLVGFGTQRPAASALAAVSGRITQWWFEPIRRAVLMYASVPRSIIDVQLDSSGLFSPAEPHGERTRQPLTITYISRQGGRRRRCLRKENHEELVEALGRLSTQRGWEFNHIQAELLSQEEQLHIAARTTILVGVHGNGLTHLLSMPLTKLSAVVEIFFPLGFLRDYEWTATALGHQYYGVWNNTVFQHPSLPDIGIPEGFQGCEIPVSGVFVVKLIEDHVEEVMEGLAF